MRKITDLVFIFVVVSKNNFVFGWRQSFVNLFTVSDRMYLYDSNIPSDHQI